jgi:hypothetical protein
MEHIYFILLEMESEKAEKKCKHIIQNSNILNVTLNMNLHFPSHFQSVTVFLKTSKKDHYTFSHESHYLLQEIISLFLISKLVNNYWSVHGNMHIYHFHTMLKMSYLEMHLCIYLLQMFMTLCQWLPEKHTHTHKNAMEKEILIWNN